MRTKGREQVSAFVPDNLIAGNRHPVDCCHVVIKAGQKLERGSVLEEDSAEEGKYVLLGGTALEGNQGGADGDSGSEGEASGTETVSAAESKAEYILAEDVDAAEEDSVGLVYRTGEFAENALIVGNGYKITDQDRKMLRNAGIFLTMIMM